MKRLIHICMIFMVCFSFSFFSPNQIKSVHASCDLQVNANTGQWMKGNTVYQSNDEAKKASPDCFTDADSLGSKILTFIKIISTLCSVFAVGMIIYGGFKYVTCVGEPRKAEEAKTMIWYSAVGLFIILAAFTILQLFVHASGGI